MIDPKDKIIKGLTERVNELEAQLHDALLAEREACAKLCDDLAGQVGNKNFIAVDQRQFCAKQIRARSKHD